MDHPDSIPLTPDAIERAVEIALAQAEENARLMEELDAALDGGDLHAVYAVALRLAGREAPARRAA